MPTFPVAESSGYGHPRSMRYPSAKGHPLELHKQSMRMRNVEKLQRPDVVESKQCPPSPIWECIIRFKPSALDLTAPCLILELKCDRDLTLRQLVSFLLLLAVATLDAVLIAASPVVGRECMDAAHMIRA